MRRTACTAVVVVLVAGLGAELAPAARAADPAAAEAAKQRKQCKQGKVRMRTGKRVRCVAARKVLPKPKAIDVRRTATASVIGGDWSALRDRRGKRLPSFPKLLRKVHPRAESALLRATKAGLARFDALGATRAARAACPGSGSISSSFDAGGGLSVDMTTTAGADAGITLGMESRNGSRQVRIEIEFPGCDDATLESCPTAEGIVRGRDSKRIGVRATVSEGGRDTWSQGMSLEGETTFRGVVKDDAKLDYFEPHNTEQATLTLGGSSRGFAPLTLRTLVQRITRVDMPDGTFVLGPSIVDVSIRSEGFEGAARRAAEADIATKMRREADKQFRDLIAKAIERFRTIERNWNEPNTCATIEFTPASGTRTLRLGDTGSVTARVKAQPGGSPGRATWTALAAQNAAFSPGTAASNPATFTHGPVQQAGAGISVSAGYKAVSKAGVAQATWTQPTDTSSIRTIEGTFSGTWSFGGGTFTWTGNVTLTRALPGSGANGPFQVSGGSYTVTASGLDTASGCQMEGRKTITMLAGDLTVNGQLPAFAAPYDYSGSVIGVGVDAMSMAITRTQCELPPAGVAGLAFTALNTVGLRRSIDGRAFSGTASDDVAGLTQNWTWNLTGS